MAKPIGIPMLNLLEKALPYFIVVPFGYFLAKSGYLQIRKDVVHDSKNGSIKQTFIKTWLKQVAVDQVILKNQELKSKSMWLLEELIKDGLFQRSALQMYTRVVNRPKTAAIGKDICFVLSKTIMTSDKKFQKGGASVGTSTPEKSAASDLTESVSAEDVPYELAVASFRLFI